MRQPQPIQQYPIGPEHRPVSPPKRPFPRQNQLMLPPIILQQSSKSGRQDAFVIRPGNSAQIIEAAAVIMDVMQHDAISTQANLKETQCSSVSELYLWEPKR